MGWDAGMDMGMGIRCRCGNSVRAGESLCDRCKYYQSIFKPPVPEFESKRDRALRAIILKRTMKQFTLVKE